jgi:tetratricopeptide (TPR) repeat protein
MGEKESQLARNYTENLEAYNLYLLGRNFWNKRSREDLYKSIEYYEKALEKDPNYVLAYSGLADSYLILGNNGIISPGQAYPKAKKYALKALEIDNKLANPHTALAIMKIDYDWDWAGAEQEFKTALQLNPGYGLAHMGYAFLLSNLGRHKEAIKEVKTARDLDPLSPRFMANVGWLLYRARSYDQALEELEKAIELYPEHGNNYVYAAEVYLALDRYEEALTACQRTEEITGEEPIILMAFVYAKRDNREEAVKFLTKIIEESKKTYISPSRIAPIYGFLGDSDQAFALLEKAYSEKDNYLTYIKIDPMYDPLRADPRFQALLKRMNLD